MNLIISPNVRTKLQGKTPPVSEVEIGQCFTNRTGRYLTDDREDNQTDPPTRWFVAETDFGRLLKIVFIFKDGLVIIKTAYDPNQKEIRIYQNYG